MTPSFCPKCQICLQSESKEVVDEENDNPTSNNNSGRGDALDTIFKSQLEIINPVRKDIASEKRINKLIMYKLLSKLLFSWLYSPIIMLSSKC